jgi:hypothetical protein
MSARMCRPFMSNSYSNILAAGQASPPGAAALISILVVLAIDVRLIFFCLNDLNRRQIIAVLDRQTWTVAIVLGGPLGQAAYWMYGRGPY